MQVANEISSMITNIEYYSNKIIELANKQYDLDIEQGQSNFPILSSLTISGHWIRTYCQDMKRELEALKTTEGRK